MNWRERNGNRAYYAFAGWRLPEVGPFTIYHALESGNYLLFQAQKFVSSRRAYRVDLDLVALEINDVAAVSKMCLINRD
jgi:hypothetical protein